MKNKKNNIFKKFVKQKQLKSNNSKLYIVFQDSLNCLVKNSKCRYKISYVLMFFLPIIFLFLGYALLCIKSVNFIFRK